MDNCLSKDVLTLVISQTSLSYLQNITKSTQKCPRWAADFEERDSVRIHLLWEQKREGDSSLTDTILCLPWRRHFTFSISAPQKPCKLGNVVPILQTRSAKVSTLKLYKKQRMCWRPARVLLQRRRQASLGSKNCLFPFFTLLAIQLDHH